MSKWFRRRRDLQQALARSQRSNASNLFCFLEAEVETITAQERINELETQNLRLIGFLREQQLEDWIKWEIELS